MPVKFWQTSIRFWFFLSYLITTVLPDIKSTSVYCQSATSRICCCRNVLFIKVSSNRNRPKELICFEGKKAPELAIGKSTHQLLWSVTERRWLLLLLPDKSLTAVPHTWNYIFWFPILDTTLTDFFFKTKDIKKKLYDRRNSSNDRNRDTRKSR